MGVNSTERLKIALLGIGGCLPVGVCASGGLNKQLARERRNLHGYRPSLKPPDQEKAWSELDGRPVSLRLRRQKDKSNTRSSPFLSSAARPHILPGTPRSSCTSGEAVRLQRHGEKAPGSSEQVNGSWGLCQYWTPHNTDSPTAGSCAALPNGRHGNVEVTILAMVTLKHTTVASHGPYGGESVSNCARTSSVPPGQVQPQVRQAPDKQAYHQHDQLYGLKELPLNQDDMGMDLRADIFTFGLPGINPVNWISINDSAGIRAGVPENGQEATV